MGPPRRTIVVVGRTSCRKTRNIRRHHCFRRCTYSERALAIRGSGDCATDGRVEEYIIEIEWEKQENREGSRIPLRCSSYNICIYTYTNTDPHVTTNKSHPFNCTLHVPIVIIGSVVLSLFYYIFIFSLPFFSFLFDPLALFFYWCMKVRFKFCGDYAVYNINILLILMIAAPSPQIKCYMVDRVCVV